MDPLIKSQLLYQLSYTPIFKAASLANAPTPVQHMNPLKCIFRRPATEGPGRRVQTRPPNALAATRSLEHVAKDYRGGGTFCAVAASLAQSGLDTGTVERQ